MLVVVQKFVYGFLYKNFGFYMNIVGVTERFTNILKNSSRCRPGIKPGTCLAEGKRANHFAASHPKHLLRNRGDTYTL